MKKLFILLFAAVIILAGCSNSESKDANVITMVVKDLKTSNEMHMQYIDAIEKGVNEMYGTNYDLQLIDTPEGTDSYSEAVTLMINSGDIPDIIYWQGAGDIALSSQGVFLDLTPYIEESTYIKDAMYPHNAERVANYPYIVNVQPLTGGLPVVANSTIEKVPSVQAVIDNPTVENYQIMFEDMVEAGYESGVTVAGKISELDVIFDSAFGINQTWVKDENGQYIHKYVSEETKEKLTFYSELYANNLLDQSYLTNEWDVKEEKFYAYESGVIVGSSAEIINIYDKNLETYNEGDGVTILPPASSELGSSYAAVDVSKEERGWAISSQAADPQACFNVLDFMASPEGQKIDRYGLEGIHYTEENGIITFTEEYQNWYSVFFTVEDPQIPGETSEPLYNEIELEANEMLTTYYQEDNTFVIPSDQLANLDGMTNVYNEFAADVITGKRSIDEWDQYVADFYAAGGQALTDYANTVLE